jgi:hypothetical protein
MLSKGQTVEVGLEDLVPGASARHPAHAGPRSSLT